MILTLGHSTRSLEELVALLRHHEAACLADVRSVPRSRRLPHFGHESLAAALPAVGVRYEHMRELGGFRRPRPGSPNTGWRVGGFRGYADHMATPEFRDALERLERLARAERTAIMCAESLWWRCHRRLIADALVVGGWLVLHVGAGAAPEQHRLTPFAHIEDGVITYPAAQPTLDV